MVILFVKIISRRFRIPPNYCRNQEVEAEESRSPGVVIALSQSREARLIVHDDCGKGIVKQVKRTSYIDMSASFRHIWDYPPFSPLE